MLSEVHKHKTMIDEQKHIKAYREGILRWLTSLCASDEQAADVEPVLSNAAWYGAKWADWQLDGWA